MRTCRQTTGTLTIRKQVLFFVRFPVRVVWKRNTAGLWKNAGSGRNEKKMKINGMSLEQYSQEFAKKYGNKKNLEKYSEKGRKYVSVTGKIISYSPKIPATFEEILYAHIRGHELIKGSER